MKKFIGTLLILLLLSSCADEKPKGNLQITGNVKGLKKGTLYIQKLRDTTLVLMDSIVVNGDSEFATELNIESPEMLYLFLDRGVTDKIDNNLMFFAAPGKITIETNLETFYADAKITGSKNHDLYEEFKKVKGRFSGQELELVEKRLKAFQSGETVTEAESQAKSDAITKKKYLYAINFALNNKAYEVSPYIALSEIRDANIKYLDTIHKSLAPKVAQSHYGKMLAELIAERKKTEGQ